MATNRGAGLEKSTAEDTVDDSVQDTLRSQLERSDEIITTSTTTTSSGGGGGGGGRRSSKQDCSRISAAAITATARATNKYSDEAR